MNITNDSDQIRFAQLSEELTNLYIQRNKTNNSQAAINNINRRITEINQELGLESCDIEDEDCLYCGS